MESKEQNKRTNKTETDSEIQLSEGEQLGRRVEKGKGLRSINWELQNSHRDVKYSIGNVVNNIVITMDGARWVLEILRGTLNEEYDFLTTILYSGN